MPRLPCMTRASFVHLVTIKFNMSTRSKARAFLLCFQIWVLTACNRRNTRTSLLVNTQATSVHFSCLRETKLVARSVPAVASQRVCRYLVSPVVTIAICLHFHLSLMCLSLIMIVSSFDCYESCFELCMSHSNFPTAHLIRLNPTAPPPLHLHALHSTLLPSSRLSPGDRDSRLTNLATTSIPRRARSAPRHLRPCPFRSRRVGFVDVWTTPVLCPSTVMLPGKYTSSLECFMAILLFSRSRTLEIGCGFSRYGGA